MNCQFSLARISFLPEILPSILEKIFQWYISMVYYPRLRKFYVKYQDLLSKIFCKNALNFTQNIITILCYIIILDPKTSFFDKVARCNKKVILLSIRPTANEEEGGGGTIRETYQKYSGTIMMNLMQQYFNPERQYDNPRHR